MYSATKKSANVSHVKRRCHAHWPIPPHGSCTPVGANCFQSWIAAADGLGTVQYPDAGSSFHLLPTKSWSRRPTTSGYVEIAATERPSDSLSNSRKLVRPRPTGFERLH